MLCHAILLSFVQGPDIEVVPPPDDRLRFVIDTTAAYVLRDGPDFEQVGVGMLAAAYRMY